MSTQRIPKGAASTQSFRPVYPAAYYTFSLRCSTFVSNKIQLREKSNLLIYCFLPMLYLLQYILLPPILYQVTSEMQRQSSFFFLSCSLANLINLKYVFYSLFVSFPLPTFFLNHHHLSSGLQKPPDWSLLSESWLFYNLSSILQPKRLFIYKGKLYYARPFLKPSWNYHYTEDGIQLLTLVYKSLHGPLPILFSASSLPNPLFFIILQ